MHSLINEDKVRDSMFKGELNRDACDEDDVCQFLLSLKWPNGLIADYKEEWWESEWKQVVRNAKNWST